MGRGTCDGTAYRNRVPSGGAVAVCSNDLGKYPAPDRIAFHGSGGRCGPGSGNGAGGPSRYRRRLANLSRDSCRGCGGLRELAVAGDRPVVNGRDARWADRSIAQYPDPPVFLRRGRPGHSALPGRWPRQHGLSECAICQQAAALARNTATAMSDFLPPACRRSSRDKKDGPCPSSAALRA